jgi:hypothetical protein
MTDLPKFRSGDLFRIANDDGRDYPIACVGINGGPYDYGAYALGYFEAAHQLLVSIHDDRTYVDPLIYPLCFLYRQGIELAIKHLIAEFAFLYRESSTPTLSHDLNVNWHTLRSYLVRQQMDYPREQRITNETLEWIDSVLSDFVAVDPASFVFRYPLSKTGDLYLQDMQHINVTNLGRFMEPLADWFQELITISGQMVYDALPDGRTIPEAR